jgi:hypothetical protein
VCKSLGVKMLPYFHVYRGQHGRVASFSASVTKVQRIRDAIDQFGGDHMPNVKPAPFHSTIEEVRVLARSASPPPPGVRPRPAGCKKRLGKQRKLIRPLRTTVEAHGGEKLGVRVCDRGGVNRIASISCGIRDGVVWCGQPRWVRCHELKQQWDVWVGTGQGTDHGGGGSAGGQPDRRHDGRQSLRAQGTHGGQGARVSRRSGARSGGAHGGRPFQHVARS